VAGRDTDERATSEWASSPRPYAASLNE
jgi:hypothetical protein